MTLSGRLHHVGIAVSDLDAAVQWYCRHLDLTVEQHFTLDEAQVEVVKLVSPGGVRVELLTSLRDDRPGRSEAGVVVPGAKHLCFEVDDVEETAAELRWRGVALVQEPKRIEVSREKTCWIADNEGNLIEFIEELGAPTA